MLKPILPATLAIAMASLLVGTHPSCAQEDTPPAGVQQLLPRNGIPSIFEPKFVPADEAEIPDDAWVMGVIMGDEARAYSLNLLNRHEIVNDRVDGQPIAAVW